MDYQIIDEKVLGKTVGSDGSFTQMKRMHIVCDTVSGIPEPEPAWSAGSRCDVLADGGSVYQLSTEREWKPVNFYNRGGGGFVPENYYTKTQTDTRITEKVAEIVNNAPEDFDTLKEMSDWIASHEESAAAMNTAIQGKVDKVTGKVLSDNNYTTSEKTKLAGLENYDDSAVRSQIGKLVDAGAKNKLKINTESRAIFTSDLMNTVTCSGTSDGNAFINLNYVDNSTATIPPGNWVVAGFGDMSHLRFRYTENEAAAKATGEYGSPLRFTVPSSGVTLNYLRLENREAGQVFDNVVLKIMLCTAEDYENSPEFVPYIPTNHELYEMILALQNKE